MRALIPLSFLATMVSFCHASAQERSAPKLLTTPQEVESALKEVILKYYPDATLTLNDRIFAAQANTMEFTIHNILRDGTIKEIPGKQIGPKHNGFMISVKLKEGRYGGPLMLPQTLGKPYWRVHVGQIVNREQDTHLFTNYKFGSGIATDFHRSMLRLLSSTPSRGEGNTRDADEEFKPDDRCFRGVALFGAASCGGRTRSHFSKRC